MIKRIRTQPELTVEILECFVRYGPALSSDELCQKLKISGAKIKEILFVLEKREYVVKTKDKRSYILGEKIALLI